MSLVIEIRLLKIEFERTEFFTEYIYRRSYAAGDTKMICALKAVAMLLSLLRLQHVHNNQTTLT